jgi:hypothetical protein
MDMAIVLKLHIFAIAFWLGVLGVEFIIEQGRALNEVHRYAVAQQHFKIDMFFEMPAFMLALITGLILIDPSQSSLLYWTKVGLGLIAVTGNVICLVPITLRKFAADKDCRKDVLRHSRTVDRISAVAVPAGLLALFVGAVLR